MAVQNQVIFIPQFRWNTLFVGMRRERGAVFYRLAEQKGFRITERYLMVDRMHMLIHTTPKLAVLSVVVGYLKGRSAIHLWRTTV